LQPHPIQPTIELDQDNQKPKEFEEMIHLAGCFPVRWKYGLLSYHREITAP
jgi:hypothetical protein